MPPKYALCHIRNTPIRCHKVQRYLKIWGSVNTGKNEQLLSRAWYYVEAKIPFFIGDHFRHNLIEHENNYITVSFFTSEE